MLGRKTRRKIGGVIGAAENDIGSRRQIGYLTEFEMLTFLTSLLTVAERDTVIAVYLSARVPCYRINT